MRFSLRTLMLMFPALIIAWFLAAFIYSQSRGMGPHSKWIDEDMKLKQLHSAGGSLTSWSRRLVEVDKVNAWLAGKIAYTDPKFQAMTRVLPEYQMNDLHQQPYHCVALDQNQKPMPDAKSAVRLGFYSLGKDGKSATHGLDPDDLNSWEEEIHPYHREQSNLQHYIKILEIVPFTLIGVLLLGRAWFGKTQDNVVATEQ